MDRVINTNYGGAGADGLPCSRQGTPTKRTVARQGEEERIQHGRA